MPFESSLKKTYNLFKKNVEIPWVKDNIQKIIEEKDFPLLLSDLNNTIFTPTIELDDSIFCLPPPGEKSATGNPILKPFMKENWLYHHPENSDRESRDTRVPYQPVKMDGTGFNVKVKKSLRGFELILDDPKLSDREAELLEDYEQMNSVGVVPLFKINGNKGIFLGTMPRKSNRLYRTNFWDGYLYCLFSNVMHPNSQKEQIIIRKSGIQETNDVEMKLPSHFFKNRTITYQLCLEEEDITILLSLKNDYIQIIRVASYVDTRVFISKLEELINEEGYITSRTVRNYLNQYLEFLDLEGDDQKTVRSPDDERNVQHQIISEAKMNLKNQKIDPETFERIKDSYEGYNPKGLDADGDGYEQFSKLILDWGLISENTLFQPNRPVVSELMTPSYPWLYGSSMEVSMIPKETEAHQKWIDEFTNSIFLSMKLFSTFQDPKSKETMGKLTRQYRRGEKDGKETKFKIWGIKANLIVPGKRKKLGNRNRSHYVRGHFRRQPIKNIDYYGNLGYQINQYQNQAYYDKYISSHWRGNSELGIINTIYFLGKSNRGPSSSKAIRWLQKIANEREITIKHANNGGEQVFSIGNGKYIRVDGYCQETNEVFEFYGDYWHGNPLKYRADDVNKTNKKRFGDLYEETIQRENWIRNLGLDVVTIWENEFDK